MNDKNKKDLPSQSTALIISLVSKLGLPGAFVTLLMIYGSKEQFQEFINIYVLLKFPKNSSLLPVFIIFYVILISAGTIFYYSRRIKLKDERIRILEDQVRELQKPFQKSKVAKKSNTKV